MRHSAQDRKRGASGGYRSGSELARLGAHRLTAGCAGFA
ncbi:MAG: hypothetical protein OJF61_000965 [Rhodanobacteraceae bacterium]|nr:MAG: hypothetical protein OJF61_000965 [Rhodanobacteraceae bacterium]